MRLIVIAYRYAAYDANNRPMDAPMEPNLGVQFLEIGEEEVESDPLPEYTSMVCIKAEEDCYVSFGGDYIPIESGERLYYGTSAGAVLTVTEDPS